MDLRGIDNIVGSYGTGGGCIIGIFLFFFLEGLIDCILVLH